MKFKKPNSASAQNGLTMVAGAVAGAMTSKGVMSLVPDSQVANTKLYRGGIIALATLGLIAVEGNDTLTTATKGAFVGMATSQALSLVSELMPASTTEPTTALGKFKQAALGCPCQEQGDLMALPNTLNRPKRKALRSPEFDVTRFYKPQYTIAPAKPASAFDRVA